MVNAGSRQLFDAARVGSFGAIMVGMNITRDMTTIDMLMREVDRSLLRENLKLGYEQRLNKHFQALQMVEELRRAGKKQRENGH